MKLRKLIEEFSDFIIERGEETSLYKNPTRKEIEEAAKEFKTNNLLRFLIFGKDLYLFNPKAVIHYDVEKKLKIPDARTIVKGMIEKRNGNWVFYRADAADHILSDYYQALKSRKKNISFEKSQFDSFVKNLEKATPVLKRYFDSKDILGYYKKEISKIREREK